MRRLVSLIILVVPCHASSDLFKTHVLRLQYYLSYNPSVPVMFGPFNTDDLIEDRLRKVLSTFRAESLTILGCIDAEQTYSMVRVRRIQHGDRVAILNANDSALEDNRGCDVSGVSAIW